MSSVSIVIPCFNQNHYLMDAIHSVFAQDLQDFEIIVVDDGSTEKVPESFMAFEASSVVRRYQLNLSLIHI